jgi:hypothetical protein
MKQVTDRIESLEMVVQGTDTSRDLNCAGNEDVAGGKKDLENDGNLFHSESILDERCNDLDISGEKDVVPNDIDCVESYENRENTPTSSRKREGTSRVTVMMASNTPGHRRWDK